MWSKEIVISGLFNQWFAASGSASFGLASVVLFNKLQPQASNISRIHNQSQEVIVPLWSEAVQEVVSHSYGIHGEQ